MTPRKFPTGIRPHRDGWRVRVRVHAGPRGVKSKKFKKSATFREMTDWMDDRRIEAADEPTLAPRQKRGFEKDAADYLKSVAAMPSYRDRERDIQAWVAVFGTRERRGIQASEIRTQLVEWAKTLSASSVNHRRSALMHLWTVLDGRQARNPVKDVPKHREPDARPRAVPYNVIDAILAAMPECKTKARLDVLAHTGIPPATLTRITREDLNLAAKTVYLTGRQKGAGTKGGWRKLTQRGVAAFERFVRCEAFGPFSSGSLYQVFKRARTAVAPDGSLDHIRPYDFRHSFGTRVLALTGDMKATQTLMGHTNAKTTERYALAAVDYRVDRAIAALDEHT